MVGGEKGGIAVEALPLPESFVCPLTREVMVQPVVTVDGQVYEREAIERWFRHGVRTSPLTGALLPSVALTEERALGRAIGQYLALRPELSQGALQRARLESALDAANIPVQQREQLKVLAAKLAVAVRGPEGWLREAAWSAAQELSSLAESGPLAWEDGEKAPGLPARGSQRAQENGRHSPRRGRTGVGASALVTLHEPWRGEEGKVFSGCCEAKLEGHSGSVTSLAALSLNVLASSSGDKSIKIWDVKERRCLETLKGHAYSVISVAALGPTRLASGSSDSTIKVWDLSGAARCLTTLQGHGGPVACVAALEVESTVRAGSSPLLASASEDGTIKIWSVEGAGQCLQTLRGHIRMVRCLVSLGSARLASGSDDELVKIWEVQADACGDHPGRCVQTLQGHGDSVFSLASLSSGRRTASGSKDGTVRVWDVGSGCLMRTLRGHGGPVRSIADLGSGLLASGSEDSRIMIWNTETGVCVGTLEGHAFSVMSVVVLRPGLFASGSRDDTVQLWSY